MRGEPPHRVEQLGRVARRGDHVDLAGVLEQAAQALPHEVVVLGDHDPQRARLIQRGPPHGRRGDRGASTGRSTSTVVPDGCAAETLTVPRSAATRSRMFARPPLDTEAGDERAEPATVVGDRDAQVAVAAREPDRRVRRVGVLRGVRERLAHHVVRGRLDVVGVPLGAHRGIRLDRQRDREPRDARLDRGHEAVVAQHGRVDAAGELAQVGERLAGLVLQLDELLGRELPALQSIAGEAEPGDLRHDVLLDAVVQVALEAPALVVLRGDEPLAGGAQLVELFGELRRQAHVRDGCRGLARDRSQQRPLRVAVLAAAPRPDLDAPEGLVAAHEVARLDRLAGDVTTDPDGHRGERGIRRHQPDPHPRRVEPVADRLGEPREQLARVAGLFELRAELAQHRELPLAVAEQGAVEPPLHPAAGRQQHDREDRREQDRRHGPERGREQQGGRRDPGGVDDRDEQVRRALDARAAIARPDVERAVPEDAVDRRDRDGDHRRVDQELDAPDARHERPQHERHHRRGDRQGHDAGAGAHLGRPEERTGGEHRDAERDGRPRLDDEVRAPRGPPTRATARRTGWGSTRR